MPLAAVEDEEAEGWKVIVGEGDVETEDDGTHRSTFEKGLCPGVLLVLVAAGAGAFAGLGVLARAAFRTAGLGLAEEDVGDGEGDPRFKPARRRSERSCLPLEGVAFAGETEADTEFEAFVTHLCVSGCRCVAQNCCLHDYKRAMRTSSMRIGRCRVLLAIGTYFACDRCI